MHDPSTRHDGSRVGRIYGKYLEAKSKPWSNKNDNKRAKMSFLAKSFDCIKDAKFASLGDVSRHVCGARTEKNFNLANCWVSKLQLYSENWLASMVDSSFACQQIGILHPLPMCARTSCFYFYINKIYINCMCIRNVIWNVYFVFICSSSVVLLWYVWVVFRFFRCSVFRLLLRVPHFHIKAVNKSVYAPSHPHIQAYIYIISLCDCSDASTSRRRARCAGAWSPCSNRQWDCLQPLRWRVIFCATIRSI